MAQTTNPKSLRPDVFGIDPARDSRILSSFDYSPAVGENGQLIRLEDALKQIIVRSYRAESGEARLERYKVQFARLALVNLYRVSSA